MLMQYTILLFTILAAEVVTVAFLAVLRDKVTLLRFLVFIVVFMTCVSFS